MGATCQEKKRCNAPEAIERKANRHQLKPANLFARKCTTVARVNIARAPQQAIATGLCKARRAGVKLSAPKRGRSSAKVRKQAQRG
jgi:hypothetical protein